MASADPLLSAAADPFRPRVYRVAAVQRELDDTVTLGLEPLSGQRPAFRPGQFNMLYAFGVGEVAISVSGPLDAPGFVHTVRSVGAVSAAIAALPVGGELGVRGPYGSAWPLDEAQGDDVVFVAGGLGLAPLRPAIYQVLAQRERYGRVAILFGARNPEGLLFRRELEQWRSHLDVDVQVTVDHADTDWHGTVGVVPALVARAGFDADEALAMVCGPEVMMRFTVDALRDAGMADERIYVSMERNMKCAIGLCGHCQFGPHFVCKDGPVMRFDRIASIFPIPEV